MSISSGRASASDVTTRSDPVAQLAVFLTFFGTTFNAGLCLANTAGVLSVNSRLIAVLQIAILITGLAAVRGAVTSQALQACLLVVGSTFALHLINPDVDLKILFDFGLIPVFIWLGRRVSISQAQRLVEILLAVVAVFGLLEMFLPEWYQKTFDIWRYYSDKSATGPDTVNYTSGNFLTNGERPEWIGRGLFPMFFSTHRAGSIFLESVSAGNFPIICLVWLLSVRQSIDWRRHLAFGLVGVCIVLPDSRFAAACCVIVLAAYVSKVYRAAALVAMLPILVMMMLWIAGNLQSSPGLLPQLLNDDFSGRLIFSGRLLAFWTWRNWLGLDVSPVGMSDDGYAYVINNLGLLGAAFAWLCFALQPVRTSAALKFRGLLTVYIACGLCVGTSLFSIKTAALAWFLYGAAGGREVARLPADQRRRGPGSVALVMQGQITGSHPLR